MTREEFDRHYAATMLTTEGFTETELALINDAVFAAVCSEDFGDDDRLERDTVRAAFEREFNRY